MEILFGEPPQKRTEMHPFTAKVIQSLLERGCELLAVEIDECSDNLFFNILKNTADLSGSHYIQIELDPEYYSDEVVFFVRLKLRMHSGGDLWIGNDIEFEQKDQKKYINVVRDFCLAA